MDLPLGDRQRRLGRLLTLDQNHRRLVSSGRAIVSLKRRPHARDLFRVQCLGNDLDLFDLLGEFGSEERLHCRWQSSAGANVRRIFERSANRFARQHRRFVKQLHAVAEQYLRVQILGAVRSEQVMKIQSERWITDSLTRGVASRQADVAPRSIRRHLIQKEIQLALLIVGNNVDTIRRKGRHDHIADEAGDVAVDQPVVE